MNAKAFLLGILAGVLTFGLVRFLVTPWADPPHYHANWALFVNGEPLDLSADRYMEDVAACVAAGVVRPEERVHMHNNEDGVVHVHHSGVTWGHFLANLGFAAGEEYLILDEGGRLFSGPERTLKFVVNGFVVPDIQNRLIRSGDRLLISFGPESAEHVVAEQFPRVAANADAYNQREDPAGCAGAVDAGLRERLRRAFWG